MSKFKWTDDNEAALEVAVGTDTPVTLVTVATVAPVLGTSERSVAAKLRNMGYDVEKVSNEPTFSADETATLVEFIGANPGTYTYAEIAEQVFGETKTAKQVQGKILSLEMYDDVKDTEPKERVKTYTDAEEAVVLLMMKEGDNSLESIADAVDKPLNSVRGKCLSLVNANPDLDFPVQANKVETVDPLDALGDVSGMTVAEIAEAIGKTERGIKTMLTRRGINASNHKGADKRTKLDKAA